MFKKLIAFAEVVLVVFLSILIIAIFTFYISFSKDDAVPSVFGYSFFVLNSSDMQNENGTGINNGALVIAENDKLDTLKEGMVILCDVNDVEGESPKYSVLRIYSINVTNEMTSYTVSDEAMSANKTYTIGKEKIVAKCKYSSDTLGQIITFSKTTQGLLILIVIPCIVLIALQIVHIVSRVKRNKFEEAELETFEFPSDMTFPDDDETSPLYAPGKLDFAKKADVKENFSDKTASDTQNAKIEKKSKKTERKTESDDKKQHDKSDTQETKKNENEIEAHKETSNSSKNKNNYVSNTENALKKSALEKTDNSRPEAAPDEKAEKREPEAAENKINITAKSDELVTDEAARESEKSVEALNENTDSTSVNNDSTDQKTEPNEHKQKNADDSAGSEQKPQKTDPEKPEAKTAGVVKKKTTVKKRATVKRTPSASATDLLKAIDTETKKLK